MFDFYEHFYRATQTSAAHASFCRRVFGLDLCQHGFADVGQLDALLAAASVRPNHSVLDIGCGNGLIAEYLAERSGACVAGLDFAPEAIRQANARAAGNCNRLAFFEGDINNLHLPAGAYDVITSIDSIYFSQDFVATVAALKRALRPGGRLAFYYSFGREPWVPVDKFPTAQLPAFNTPLAHALQANGLPFLTLNFTADEYRLATLRKSVLTNLRAQFEAEDNLILYENRLGDANGISEAIEEGLHRRYLYVTTPVAGGR